MSDKSDIDKLGWRQGRLLGPKVAGRLRAEIHDKALPTPPTEGEIFVVITQDCDLVHHSQEAEPWVEALRLVPAPTEKNDFAYGKNPRRLQLYVTAQDAVVRYEAFVHERVHFPRTWLTTEGPLEDRLLSPSTVSLLTNWIAKRYTRDAQPHVFNERLRPQVPAITALFKKYGHLFTHAFIRNEPDEDIPVDEIYKVWVRLVMSGEDYALPARRDQALAAVTQLELLLNKVEGFETSVEVVSSSDFPLSDLDYLKYWDYDYLTYRQECS